MSVFTLWCVRETLAAVEKQYYILCVCVCVCVALVIQQKKKHMRRIILSFVACLAAP